MEAIQYISASALSITLGGNAGVAPFLTLFLVGIIERIDPSLLNMEEWVSKAVASWPSVSILGALTIVEFVAKCVPCVDAVYESSMTFVAPILSVFGSMSAFGLFNVVEEEESRMLYTEHNYNMTEDYFSDAYIMRESDYHRKLTQKSDGLIILQVILCFVGVIIAILVHLFQLLMRVIGEGCCTCCITSIEYTWTITSVIVTILIVPIAIVTAIILIIAALVGFKKKVWDERMEEKRKAAMDVGSIDDNIEEGRQKVDNNSIDEKNGTTTKTSRPGLKK